MWFLWERFSRHGHIIIREIFQVAEQLANARANFLWLKFGYLAEFVGLAVAKLLSVHHAFKDLTVQNVPNRPPPRSLFEAAAALLDDRILCAQPVFRAW